MNRSKAYLDVLELGNGQPGVNNFVEDHRRQKPENIQLDLILAWLLSWTAVSGHNCFACRYGMS